MGLENAGFPEPCLHVERRAGFGCQFVMPYDGCAGKPGGEIPDVVFEGAFLLAECGVSAGGRAVPAGDSSGVCDVTAGGVVTTAPLVISQGSTVRSSLLGTSRSTLPSRWMRSV